MYIYISTLLVLRLFIFLRGRFFYYCYSFYKNIAPWTYCKIYQIVLYIIHRDTF